MAPFDVAIVGAGPAGSWAARALARRGARVALIDGTHPREKPCGGGVTGRALAMVREAVDPASIAAVPIETATFVDGSRRATVRLGAYVGGHHLAIVSRRDFDAALLNAAIAAGVSLVPARAAEIRRAHGGWAIATKAGEVTAPWLVGADGANSLVRRRVALPFPREDLSLATGYFVHGVTSREVTVVFEHEPPGYLWAFPRHDHIAVGVGAQADASSSRTLLAVAADWIRAAFPVGTVRLERYSWPIPSLGEASLARERPAGPGWMLIGDAGGLVDPVTREGIFFALASAEAAAESLAAPDPAGAYAARLRDGMYTELRRAARLKDRFFHHRFTALMITGLQRSARIREVMADLVAGEQTYRGLRRRLLRTLEFRLMWQLLAGRGTPT